MRNLKKILALVLALVMSFSVMSVAGAAYADQDAVDANDYAAAVNALTAVGLFKGDANTNEFRPNEPVLRREAATVIYRLASKDFDNEYDAFYGSAAIFKDATAEDWWSGAVNYCKMSGYINGKSADTFAPNDYVTGYEVLAMTLRVAGCDPKNEKFVGGNWATAVAIEATKLGLLDSVKGVNLQAPASRALVAQLVFATVTNEDLKDSFKLGLQQVANEKDVDDWGRVTTTNGWYLADFTYDGTETVTEAALATGEKFTADELKAIEKKLVGEAVLAYVNGEKTTIDTTKGIEFKGQVIELHKDRIIVIKTDLVKVTAVDAKKGEVTLSNGKTVKGEFTVGQYLTTQYNANLKNEDESARGYTEYTVVAATQIVEKKVLARVADGVYYIEGTKTVPAHGFVNFAGELKLNTPYNWIYDEKGNLIGVDEYKEAPKDPEAPAPKTYVIVLATMWKVVGDTTTGGFDAVTTKGSKTAMAQVMYLDGTVAEVTLGGYYADNKDGFVPFTQDYDANGIKFGADNEVVKNLEGNLYEYTLNKDGNLVLKVVENAVNGEKTYKKGDAQQISGKIVNAKTVYYILNTDKDGKFSMTSVVGYNAVDTFKAERVVYVADGNYVQFVYVPAVIAEEQKPEIPEDTSTSTFYYMTADANVTWGTELTLTGLVDMNGNAVELKLDKSFSYDTLMEMIELYAGTILEITTNTNYVLKDGKYEAVVTNEIGSVLTGVEDITVTEGNKTKTLVAEHIEFVKDAEGKGNYAMDADMLIVGSDVYYLNAVKTIVDDKGNKVELADLKGTENLYVVYSLDKDGKMIAETIVVTFVTEKTLKENFAELKVNLGDIKVDAELLTYTIGEDVEAFKAALVDAIMSNEALAFVAKVGGVTVIVDIDNKVVTIDVPGYEQVKIALTVIEAAE